MTALTLVGQAVSLWLMWRYRHDIGAAPKGSRNNPRRSELSEPSP